MCALLESKFLGAFDNFWGGCRGGSGDCAGPRLARE